MMYIFNLFLCFCLTPIVSSHGIGNLLGFYTGFRKLCLCRCGISSSNVHNGRSLDSELYGSYDMPWLAIIHIKTTILRGTLISDRHVLTAANPLYRTAASEITVTLGLGAHDLCKEGGHVLNTSVEAVLIHPDYSAVIKNRDIALLKLRNTVQFSQFISPICMPIYDTGESEHLAWSASWLKNYSELCLTRVTTVSVLSYCEENILSYSMDLSSDKGCLGHIGTKNILCKNDIGGPIMTRWKPGYPFRLIGVINYASCDQEASPIFTRIIDNLLWIHEHIRKDCQCF